MSPRAGDWIETTTMTVNLHEADVPSCGGLDRNLESPVIAEWMKMSPRAGDWIETSMGLINLNPLNVPSCGGLDRNLLLPCRGLRTGCPLVRGTG